MTTGSHTGTFATVAADRSLSGGLGLAVDYSDPSSLRLNVVRSPDLSVTLDGPGAVAKGTNATYVATIRNNGPVDASGVTVTFDRPAGTTLVGASSSPGCSSTMATITCTIGDLATGVSVDRTVVLATSAIGSFTEHATVASDTSDSVTTNDTVSVVTQVAVADLSATLSGPATGSVGATLTYTATVANNGPVGATGITVTMVRPPNTSLHASSSVGCTSGSTITCSVGGLVSGASTPVTIALVSNSGQTITPSVTVLPSADDPVPTNNTSATVTTSITNADLSLSKLIAAPASLSLGGNTLLTGTVTNIGAGSATGVVYITQLPSTWTLDPARTVIKVGTASTADTCSRSNWAPGIDRIRCELTPPLAAQGSATFQIGVSPDAIGSTNVLAFASFAQIDPDTSNNNRIVKITVANAPVDVAVSLTDAPDPVRRNEVLTYTATVTNNGTGVASNLVVSLDVPASVTGITVAPSTSCTATSPVICSFTSLAAGRSTTVAVKGRPQAEGAIAATATASVSDPDTDPTNNSASVSTNVTPNADLSITYTASPTSVLPGQDLTLTVKAVNNGPSTATNARGTITLGNRVTVVSASGCSGTGPFTCSFGDLATGATATRTVVVRPRFPGSLTNSAVVASDVEDPKPTTNTKALTTTVRTARDGRVAFQRTLTNGTIDLYAKVDPTKAAVALSGATATSCSTGANQCANSLADDMQPAWSPDGRRLAFASNRDGDYDVYVIDSTYKTGLVNLTPANPGRDELPAWSPDGTRIVYAAPLAGVPHLFVRDLANPTADPIDLGVGSGPDWSPWLGPDCSAIAYQREVSGTMQVFVMAAPDAVCAPGELRYVGQVTSSTIPPQEPGAITTAGASFDPSWTPNGTGLVVDSSRDGAFDLFVIGFNADGSLGYRRLTRSAFGVGGTKNGYAAVSPSGVTVVYEGNVGADRRILGVPLATGAGDGTGITTWSSGAQDTKPDWQAI
jgi:uncharacterized repeat protein (TIGR01451 family)